MTNEERIEIAENAIDLVREAGLSPEECLVDLLADLMHWADSVRVERVEEVGDYVDFDRALGVARIHFCEETLEEIDGIEEDDAL